MATVTLAVWPSGNGISHISYEVTVRQTQLVGYLDG